MWSILFPRLAKTVGLACPPIPAQTILRPSGPRLPSCPPWPPTLPTAKLMVVSRIFGLWRDFRQGLIDRPGLRAKLEPVRIELHAALEAGKQCADKRVRRFCRNSSRQGFERLPFPNISIFPLSVCVDEPRWRIHGWGRPVIFRTIPGSVALPRFWICKKPSLASSVEGCYVVIGSCPSRVSRWPVRTRPSAVDSTHHQPRSARREIFPSGRG